MGHHAPSWLWQPFKKIKWRHSALKSSTRPDPGKFQIWVQKSALILSLHSTSRTKTVVKMSSKQKYFSELCQQISLKYPSISCKYQVELDQPVDMTKEADEAHFRLKSDDFPTRINLSFAEMRENSQLLDVTLCCDNGTDTISAHKLVLAACSPFFRRILSLVKNQQYPFLYLKGIHLEELQKLLTFMYYGQVLVVSQYSMDKLLSAAKELEVNGLTNVVKPISEEMNGKKRMIPCPKSIISDPNTLPRDIFVSSRPATLSK